MQIGFMGLLALLFIGLKLGGVIAWSWLWVLAPLWIGFALVVGFFLLMVVLSFVVALFSGSGASYRRRR